MERATILVVDDNAENRALAQAILEDEGHHVGIAKCGADAIELAASTAFDCILMDVRMPNIDGIEACKRIRAQARGEAAAIIFLTAQRDVETFDRALAAGGDDFLTKPYRPDDLLVRVQTAIRLRRLAAERSALFAELKQQRDRLQRVELQKEQLVAFLVHDLKNPVNAIDLYAKLVQRAAGDPDRVRTAAGKIADETRTLARMITNLLDISKADEGRLVPARVATNVAELIEHVIEELAPRAQAIDVRFEIDAGTTTAMIDPDLVGRTIANLVDNAIRHAPEGSRIRIAAKADGAGVEIRVADEGSGVPLEQREIVFERFHSSGTQRANRGLGLAFCKLAVEAHGGRIWIEDAAPGAVFCMQLPPS